MLLKMISMLDKKIHLKLLQFSALGEDVGNYLQRGLNREQLVHLFYTLWTPTDIRRLVERAHPSILGCLLQGVADNWWKLQMVRATSEDASLGLTPYETEIILKLQQLLFHTSLEQKQEIAVLAREDSYLRHIVSTSLDMRLAYVDHL